MMEKGNRYLFRGKPIDEFNEFREDLDPALDDWKNIIKKDGFIFGSLIWNDGSPFIVGDIADWSDEYIAHEYWCPVKPETVGQFTGLTDKNGKKIFEGDIVRFIWWWFDGAERESELTGTIVYSSDNMSFQLKGVKNKEWRDFVGADEHDMDYLTPFSELNFCDADFEIIGNIHDNPELLEVK